MKLAKTPQTKDSKDKSYIWYRDSKMIGTIILLIVAALQIFAFLKIPFFTTIHGYTVGMLIGYYNPFFYAYAAYFALRLIFGRKMDLPSWLKLTSFTYWFVVLSCIFIGTSLFFYQTKTSFTAIGSKQWGAFTNWFDAFTDEPAWAPANTNGGVIGAFMYSLVASISSGIGAIIASIVLLVLSLSIIVTGSFVGFYKSIANKRKQDLESREEGTEEIIFPSRTRNVDKGIVAPHHEIIENQIPNRIPNRIPNQIPNRIPETIKEKPMQQNHIIELPNERPRERNISSPSYPMADKPKAPLERPTHAPSERPREMNRNAFNEKPVTPREIPRPIKPEFAPKEAPREMPKETPKDEAQEIDFPFDDPFK